MISNKATTRDTFITDQPITDPAAWIFIAEYAVQMIRHSCYLKFIPLPPERFVRPNIHLLGCSSLETSLVESCHLRPLVPFQSPFTPILFRPESPPLKSCPKIIFLLSQGNYLALCGKRTMHRVKLLASA